MSSRKLPVAINVFPTLDYVELVQYEDKAGEIEKTASLPCHFDLANRQVANWEQMSQTIRDLYSMNRVPPGTPAVLVLPSFFSREIDLLADFSREELRFALVSEAERFYVFKKTEPQIDWINLEGGRLLYSAYPKEEIDKYVQIFQENRIPLMGIELNYFSVLRGLIATGAVREEMETQARWCLLVVSDYSFFSCIQDGSKIAKTTDAPLSTMDSDEGGTSAVSEIQQDFANFVESEVFVKLVVVNNSSRIKTEDLVIGLNLQGNVVLIEQNGQTLHSRGSESAQFPCSLEGLGGVFYTMFPEMPRLNFLPETSEDVAGIQHFRQQTLKLLAFANGGVFLLCLLLWGGLSLLMWQKDQEMQSLTKQSTELATMSNSGRFNDLNRRRFVKKVLDRNAQVNNLLVRLGKLTPADTWLEKIQITTEELGQPTQVALEGKTLKLDEVNTLLTQLSEVVTGSGLEVSNAAPLTSPDGQAYFTWTIQNKGATPLAQNGQRPGGAP